MERKPWHDDVDKIDPGWTPAMLLGSEGIFFLDDVARKLSIDTALLKSHANSFEQRKKDPRTSMGVQNADGCWLVFMEIFSKYYIRNLANRIRRIEPGWDANIMLRQQGIFLLRDVCTLIPFSTGQIRYQVSKCQDSRKEIGVWKEENVGTYLVDMPKFGKWVIGLWMMRKKP